MPMQKKDESYASQIRGCGELSRMIMTKGSSQIQGLRCRVGQESSAREGIADVRATSTKSVPPNVVFKTVMAGRTAEEEIREYMVISGWVTRISVNRWYYYIAQSQVQVIGRVELDQAEVPGPGWQ